jgi:hypothetical protein
MGNPAGVGLTQLALATAHCLSARRPDRTESNRGALVLPCSLAGERQRTLGRAHLGLRLPRCGVARFDAPGNESLITINLAVFGGPSFSLQGNAFRLPPYKIKFPSLSCAPSFSSSHTKFHTAPTKEKKVSNCEI